MSKPEKAAAARKCCLQTSMSKLECRKDVSLSKMLMQNARAPNRVIYRTHEMRSARTCAHMPCVHGACSKCRPVAGRKSESASNAHSVSVQAQRPLGQCGLS